ncbi:hypothetical protein GCM10011507_24550 [Edaphobacter acidisoli]|uniref:PPM-type phosphatase domain-containing protein n=1 Tax=Edaphobacter acidisoli TaxID=2040573 RepID=A0A916W6G7_9BACT|nr:PP2C family protein-serine/threonine phosphatase [Edaphobacter acidisoli]GGA72027.1 hypothetical protein GCM10011507_24550 [Edaphobacter acidisoli]
MLRAGLLLPLMLLLLSPSLPGEAQPAAGGTSGVASADHVVYVKLGTSAIELYGPWKFHTGDNLSWAQPGFDDSGWANMGLVPPEGSDGYVPGWTARGYAGYSGYAWYRLQVVVEGTPGPLALKMPEGVDDAYQVFVDGARIGEFGSFGTRHVTAYSALPRAFRLPPDIRDRTITIAIRMWMDSATPFNSPDAGGLHGPPVLGYASIIGAQVQLDWDAIAHYIGSGFLEMLILVMALVMALTLFWLDWDEKSYVWLAFVCLATIISNGVVLLDNFTTAVGQTASVLVTDVFATPLRIGCWVLFWGFWFGLPRIRRLHSVVWPAVFLLALGTALLRAPLYGQHVPVHAATWIEPLRLCLKLYLGVLLLVVAFQGFKRNKAEGGLAATAVIFAVFANYQHELRIVHIPTAFTIVGFSISLGSLSTIVSLLLITIMLLARFIAARRAEEQWKLEIAQARHVQEVLIPNKLPQVAGLSIESEYHPAREVGGDFFQIIPGEDDDSALVVVGDVTGKGLQAGMLVALIVGAVRLQAQVDNNPQQVLAALNRQLSEREHASATCLALRFMPDGLVQLANAGHLPPYLNGVEMQIEGALPLGILPDITYPTLSFRLDSGDSLVLMSDGVAEAQDTHGNLFGFGRTEELLRSSSSPSKIARAAKEFGQTDDILVLKVQRTTTEAAFADKAVALAN